MFWIAAVAASGLVALWKGSGRGPLCGSTLLGALSICASNSSLVSAQPSSDPPAAVSNFSEKSSAATPGTRSELLPRRRQHEPLVAHRKSKLARLDLYERFGNRAAGSGFSFGVRYIPPDFEHKALSLHALAASSTRSYPYYDLQLGKVLEELPSFGDELVGFGTAGPQARQRQHRRDFFLFGDLRRRDYRQEDFLGLGDHSSSAARNSYSWQDTFVNLVGGYRFNRWLSAAARAGLLQVDLGPGADSRFPTTQELFNDQTAPGLDRQPNFLEYSSTVLVDFRDHQGNPRRGGLITAVFDRFQDREGKGVSFNRHGFDARWYFPLGSIQRVLATRFYASFSDPDAVSRVPFYMQEKVGRGERLRSFHEYRFRDPNLAYLSVEYRWEGAPALECAVFYDAGKVFDHAGELSLTSLRSSAGWGVRFKLPSEVFLRVDLAYGSDGPQLNLGFAPSF